jgi:F-type H+-transporting ATPase subunit delta
MRGSSRNAIAAAQEGLETLLAGLTATDAAGLGDGLFGVTGALAGSPGLRRALTDPSRDGAAKATLVSGLVRSRWSASADLTDATEQLAVSSVLAGAEKAGRLEAVEDELFRFSRTIAGDQGLRDAFSARTPGGDRKGDLVRGLIGDRAAPETTRLAVQAASAPRGLRTEKALESFVEAAARRRRQLVAQVIAATPLTQGQQQRLAAALQRIYGRAVRLNVDIDPAVVGGIRVEVGGEVIDGTVVGRLDDARRRLTG